MTISEDRAARRAARLEIRALEAAHLQASDEESLDAFADLIIAIIEDEQKSCEAIASIMKRN